MADFRLDPDRDVNAPVEQGRYAIYAPANGSLVICRSAPLCDTCQACGCGEQAPPITAPAPIVSMALRAANGDMPGFLKRFTGHVPFRADA